MHEKQGSARRAERRNGARHIFALLGAAGALAAGQVHADGGPYESVVSAPRAAADRPRADSAAAATAVAPQSRPQTAGGLPELLAEVPGVSVTRLGGLGAFSTASLRGSTAEQVRIYLDGVPLDAASGGGVDLGALPLGDIERVEIYRGITPLAFGEPGLAGVISLESRAPGAVPPSVRAGWGSFGTATLGASAGARLDDIGVYAGLDALHSDGDFPYVDDQGTTSTDADDRQRRRANNRLDQVAGTCRVTIDLGERRRLSLGVLAMARRQGLAGPVRAPSLHASLQTARTISYARWQAPGVLGASSRLEAQAFFGQTDTALDDPRGEVYMVPAQTRDSTWTAGATLLAARTPVDWLRAQALLEARHESYLPRDLLASSFVARTPGSRELVAGGIEATLSVPALRLELTPGVRGQLSRDAAGAAVPVEHVLTSGRLSLVERLTPRLRLKLNLGRYGRLPSLTELYVNNGSMRGATTLRPERGTSGDAGLELDGMMAGWRVLAAAGVFGALVDDMIFWSVVRPAGAGYLTPSNAGQARVTGVESMLRVEGRWSALQAQLTYTDAAIRAGASWYPVPLRARWQAYARPEVRFDGRTLRWQLYVDGAFTSSRPAAAHGFAWMPARLVFGAGARVTHVATGLQLALSAFDLADQRGNDALGYPLPGRWFMAALTWTSPEPKQEKR